jgi:hypothetical protein
MLSSLSSADNFSPFCSASSDDSVPSKEESKEQVVDSQDKTLSVEFLKEAPPPTEKTAKPHGKTAILIADQPKSNPPAATASAFLQNVSCLEIFCFIQ